MSSDRKDSIQKAFGPEGIPDFFNDPPDDFIRNIVHEFREERVTIKTWVEILKRDPTITEEHLSEIDGHPFHTYTVGTILDYLETASDTIEILAEAAITYAVAWGKRSE